MRKEERKKKKSKRKKEEKKEEKRKKSRVSISIPFLSIRSVTPPLFCSPLKKNVYAMKRRAER